MSKSLDAFILGLDTINSLSSSYRLEGFAILVCNAWELLLKARVIDLRRDARAVYADAALDGRIRKSKSLDECLRIVFTNEMDPVRRNIELTAEIRNAAVHLIIPTVPSEVMGLFQACVLNYANHLREWFQRELSDRVAPGLMTIMYAWDPVVDDVGGTRMRRVLGRDTAEFLLKVQAEIRASLPRSSHSGHFTIPVDYKLALVKTADQGDIILTQGAGGAPAAVVAVPRDPARTHPYRQTELLERLRALLPETQLNTYDVQCVTKAHNVKNRSEYHYKSAVKGTPDLYSEDYATWIAARFRQDPSFFANARLKAKRMRSRS